MTKLIGYVVILGLIQVISGQGECDAYNPGQECMDQCTFAGEFDDEFQEDAICVGGGNCTEMVLLSRPEYADAQVDIELLVAGSCKAVGCGNDAAIIPETGPPAIYPPINNQAYDCAGFLHKSWPGEWLMCPDNCDCELTCHSVNDIWWRVICGEKTHQCWKPVEMKNSDIPWGLQHSDIPWVGGGGGSGDPIIYGFDGGWFHFMGEHDKVFNLISDSHFQLNSRFVHDEYVPDNMTWMGDIGITVGSDKFAFFLNGTKILNGKNVAPSIRFLADGGKITIWKEAVAFEIPKYWFVWIRMH